MLALSGCGDDEEAAKCGTETCGPREQCDTEAMPPACVCREAYTGDECAACAFGYRPAADGTCEPVPIDCDADPMICGDYGACTVTLIAGNKVHQCECEEGWAGHVCQRCDSGWQDNDGDGLCLPTCAMAGLTCEEPFVCSDAEGVARCACPTGYAGDECTQCARGYHDPLGSGECTPTCSTVGLDCAERERCSDARGEPECVCIEGYAGEGCLECADGYQDNALPGDCRPGCDVAELECNDRGACDDSSGIAQCACDPGWAGAHCDTCAPGHYGDDCEICQSGWARVGDGPCTPGCGSGAFSCGTGQRCWEGPSGPECLCHIGYAGADCATCDAGFTMDGSGACVGAPPAGHVLIAHGTWRGESAVVAIDPSDGDVFGLRSMSVSGLAWDPGSGVLYTGASGGIAPVDLAAGTTGSPVAAPSHRAFTFDTTRGVLLLTGSSGTYRLDPTTGSSVAVSGTGPAWAGDAAYDGASDRLFASYVSSSILVYDADTGASEGTLTPSWPIESGYDVGLAVTASGELWALGRHRPTTEELAARGCRTAARGLFGEDYETATVTVVTEPPPGGSVEVSSTRTSGPELVVLRAYGDDAAAEATVRVATSNPDAIVCVGTYEGVYRVEIAAGARFRAVAAESYRQTLSMAVDSGFSPPASPTVHVRVADPDTADSSLFAHPEVVRTYTADEWRSRRVAVYSPSSTAEGVLARIDTTSGAVVETVAVPDLSPSGDLAPFDP